MLWGKDNIAFAQRTNYSMSGPLSVGVGVLSVTSEAQLD